MTSTSKFSFNLVWTLGGARLAAYISYARHIVRSTYPLQSQQNLYKSSVWSVKNPENMKRTRIEYARDAFQQKIRLSFKRH